jgi:type II secretory pathway pseudopilin PulG
MDDAFSLTAAQMPRTRRVSPFAVRAVVVIAVVGALITSFAMFVAGQQRAADARRAATAAEQVAAREADARAAAAAASPSSIQPQGDAVDRMLDTQARDAAGAALETAQQIASASSIDRAIPQVLASANHDVVFVDGPSTGPSVVSVFASAAGWSAAVHGSADVCYWIALGAGGQVRYGTGSTCTGMAALAADRRNW